MKIIALSGFARSGKDECAKVLVDEFGFKQVAFADKLRDMLYQLNPWTLPDGHPVSVVGASRHASAKPLRTVQEVIDIWGWNGYKETEYGNDVRRLLQRLGTEAGRQTLWDTIWIDAALTGLNEDAKVVVSDARFFNEFDAVRDRDGEIWRIDREGVGPANDHPSETEAIAYQHFGAYFKNDGTLEEYRQQIKDYANARGL